MNKTKILFLALLGGALLAILFWREPSEDLSREEEPPVQEKKPSEGVPKIFKASDNKSAKIWNSFKSNRSSPPEKNKSDDESELFDPLRDRPEQITGVVFPIRVQGEWETIQGDILISRVDPKKGSLEKVTLEKPKIWEGGVIPYQVSASFNQFDRVESAMREISESTHIRFLKRKSELDYVEFLEADEHCMSHVGKVGGKQEILISPSCRAGQITHELLHTLGFFHEQSRWDRDQYVKVLWENIQEPYQDQFAKLPPLFTHLEESPFDYESILLYGSFYFSKALHLPTLLKVNGEKITENRERLSLWDIEKINRLYEKVQED